MTDVRVYKDTRHVGTLAVDGMGRVTFAYLEDVLGDESASVSVRLPVRPAPYADHEALPCFENLLPEGDVRRMLELATHRAHVDVVGLLGVFGGECAGALSLWPDDRAPADPPRYRPCTPADVAAAYGAAGANAPLANLLRASRMSMSGAQEKLVLDRRPPVSAASAVSAVSAASVNGPDAEPPRYRLPVDGAPSTVLVKRERGVFPGLLQNELAAMRLMAAAGVPTAPHGVCALDPSVYETARFDRTLTPDGRVERHHAEDGCQLTGKVSLAKYAQTGGPTYAELVTVLRRHGADPLTDTELLFRWAVANLALGNRDAHAKNVSVLHVAPGAVRLAPVYDVVCTLAYAALEDVLPLRFAGQLAPAALTPADFTKGAREFGLAPARARGLVADVCDRLDAARCDALGWASAAAGPHSILDAMDRLVDEGTRLTRARLLGS